MDNESRIARALTFSKLLSLILIIFPSPLWDFQRQWIVWNVGQGTWITRFDNNFCLHFDMGGEQGVPEFALQHCRTKRNLVYITHRHSDHTSELWTFSKRFHLCRTGPWESELSLRITRIEECNPGIKDLVQWHPYIKTRNSNEASAVFYFKGLLFPGDSPKKFDKHWLHMMPEKIRILVLAHHGSHTGTSKNLTNKKISMAVSSSRRTKYGHPHPRIIKLLKDNKIPLLRTEVWGNIHFLEGP